MGKPFVFNNSALTLRRNSPRVKYNPSITESSSGLIVWKARRTLLSYIQFLVFNFTELSAMVFIIASGDCRHLDILADMFPKINFVVLHFGKKKHQIQKISSVYKLTDWDNLIKWKNDSKIDCYLISDYRREKTKDYIQTEKNIREELLQQQKWVFECNPLAASLLFRLPYPSKTMNSFSYLSGTCFFLPYNNKFSTDTRLEPYRENGNFVVNDWDLREYEEMMFHHNLVVRREYQYYNLFFRDSTENINPEELDNKFDSTLEVFILYSWFSFLGLPKKNAPEQISNLSNKISLLLSPPGQTAFTLRSKREMGTVVTSSTAEPAPVAMSVVEPLALLQKRDVDLVYMIDNENRRQLQIEERRRRQVLTKKSLSIPLPQGPPELDQVCPYSGAVYAVPSYINVPEIVLQVQSSVSFLRAV